MYRFILTFAIVMTTTLTNVNAEQPAAADQAVAPQAAVAGENPSEMTDTTPAEPVAAPAAEAAQAEPSAESVAAPTEAK